MERGRSGNGDWSWGAGRAEGSALVVRLSGLKRWHLGAAECKAGVRCDTDMRLRVREMIPA